MESQNIFIKNKKHENFCWNNIGDVKLGRGDLGEEMPVIVYRLMQYTMLDVLSKAHGLEQANEYFRQAGFLAGTEFTKNTMDINVDFNTFIANLQKALRDLKIGVLRMKAFDPGTGKIVLTVGQDLDCSGLPVTHENVCIYDEGFIAGILETYTKKRYIVREVDCWANGNRVCRFNGTLAEK
ncbi:MAG: 4-vinyl reductase [Treponema sp.]|nr:4-vinyl reductase [Treponema sp.]